MQCSFLFGKSLFEFSKWNLVKWSEYISILFGIYGIQHFGWCNCYAMRKISCLHIILWVGFNSNLRKCKEAFSKKKTCWVYFLLFQFDIILLKIDIWERQLQVLFVTVLGVILRAKRMKNKNTRWFSMELLEGIVHGQYSPSHCVIKLVSKISIFCIGSTLISHPIHFKFTGVIFCSKKISHGAILRSNSIA